MSNQKLQEEFEYKIDVPDFLSFDGEDYMYYGDDPLLEEQCSSVQDMFRGFKAGVLAVEEGLL